MFLWNLHTNFLTGSNYCILLDYVTSESGPVIKWIVTTTFQLLSYSLTLAKKAHANILKNNLFLTTCKLVPPLYNPEVSAEDFCWSICTLYMQVNSLNS